MTTISTAGLSTSEGLTVIYAPDEPWRPWAMKDVYRGDGWPGRYVPKVGDWILDTEANVQYKSIGLDLTTMLTTFEEVKGTTSIGMSDEDMILGVGPGSSEDTWRCYLDKSVMPYLLATDQRYEVKGVASVKAKIFRGTALDNDLKVVSAFFDPSGKLLGEDIPLELIQEAGNISRKQIPPCYTTEDMPDDEPVTVAVYGAAGQLLSKRVMLIENTGFVRTPGNAKKYVTEIRLKSPWMSKSNPMQLDYPLNLLTQGLQLTCVVVYSDGSTIEVPVDGTKAALHGLESYVSTIVGQQVGLVLTYNLSSDEIAYGAEVGETKHMTALYTALTKPIDGAYSVKLFGFPVWIDAVHGYRMEWYLYNLDRQQVFKVTPYVKFNANVAAFDPLAYGVKQTLSVSVNLKDVSGAFNAWVHTQTIDVALMAPGTSRTTNWTIAFDPMQDPPYGLNNAAKTTFVNSNQYKVRIDQGEQTQASWLTRLFRQTKPLYDSTREVQAPDPTHFSLVIGDNEVQFPISAWSSEMTVNYPLNNNATLFVKFFKRTADNDIQLAVAGLPIYQQN